MVLTQLIIFLYCSQGKKSPVPASVASSPTSSTLLSDAAIGELGASPSRATSAAAAAAAPTSNSSNNSSPAPSTSNLKADGNNKSKRLLTGLSFGKKQPAATSAAQSSPISPAPALTIQQKNALQYGLLFVQDPSLFIVVSQDKTDLKTG